MYASYVNLIHYPYTMNLDKMTPIASKIATNQQVWQDKYRITARHKDLRGNPLQKKKITGDDKQVIHYEDEDTRGGSQQS